MCPSSQTQEWAAKGDQNPDFSPSWDFATGAGLERASLGPWKARFTRLVLISRLAEEETFWRRVGRVRGGEDPLEVAKDYAYGKRRNTIATVLTCAAAETFGVELECGAATDEERRTRVRARLEISHWTVRDEPPGRGPYAHRPDFLQAILDGADLIARRGTGKCLVREGPGWCGHLAQPSVDRNGRAFRGDYCRRHSTGDGREHRWRDERMALVSSTWPPAGRWVDYPAELVDTLAISPQPLRWLGARPAPAGLCGSKRTSLPGRGLVDLAGCIVQDQRELARSERSLANLLKEGGLKVTAPVLGGMRVDYAHAHPEVVLGQSDRLLKVGVVRYDNRDLAAPLEGVEQQVARKVDVQNPSPLFSGPGRCGGVLAPSPCERGGSGTRRGESKAWHWSAGREGRSAGAAAGLGRSVAL